MKWSAICKLTLLVCLTAAFCNGCWDKKEFNQLAIAQAVAIDYSDGAYHLTIQLLMPSAAEDTITDENLWIIDGAGETVAEALREIARCAPRELYLDHLDIVLLGEGMLADDMGRGLEYLIEQHVVRRRTSLLAVEGTAGDLLEAKPELANVDIYYLSNLIRQQSKRIESSNVVINDYYLTMEHKLPEALVIPRVERRGERALNLNGAAVVQEKRLLCWMDQEWLYHYDWIHGGREIYPLPGKTAGCENLTVEIQKKKCRWELCSADPLTVRANLRGDIYIVEKDRRLDQMTREELAQLKAEVQQQVETQLQDALSRDIAAAQQAGCDAVQLGRWLYAWHPELVRGKNWRQLFSEITIDVQVETQVELFELK